jgi:hypothetical protein
VNLVGPERRAASAPGCTAVSPPHASRSATCAFVASGSTVVYQTCLSGGAEAGVEDFHGPTCDPIWRTTFTAIASSGSGSVTLAGALDCVEVGLVESAGGSGRVTATGA